MNTALDGETFVRDETLRKLGGNGTGGLQHCLCQYCVFISSLKLFRE